jgi:hypothetical protein
VKQKLALKDKILRTQINGKFNDENKLKNIAVELLFK